MNKKLLLLSAFIIVSTGLIYAEGGLSEINQALESTTNEITTLFSTIKKICYIIAGIVGIAGAVKVYSAFSAGDQDATKKAGYWIGGAIIFAALVFIIDKAFIHS